ncbi:glycoside hydrolase family 25 protein [Pseudoduganella sp. LjRoot289]|uniref:glycoside hydrolase family 25 protein n=1 Tax=Pseudoduganella sp. LjRoot289 TaxID=3342314 RepID=UPI003ECCB174
MLNGIDVYAGDGGIEWHKVAEDNNAFVFVRGAYGNVMDKAVAANAAAARAVGLKVGVYHFLRARMDPQSQIDTFTQALKLANVGPGDLPPVLDMEDNPAYDGPWKTVDNEAYLASVSAWIANVKALYGKPPIIYTRASFWTELGNPTTFGDSPLWVASYRNDAPTLPAAWPDYTFWQYSDAGTVSGITGHVDVNYFNGDLPKLQACLI